MYEWVDDISSGIKKGIDYKDRMLSGAMVKTLGPVAGGYFGDLFFDLGEDRGYLVDDFSPKTIDMIKQMIRLNRKGEETKGSINPKHYAKIFQPKGEDAGYLEKHITSPFAEIMNGVGKFDWSLNEDGSVKITERGYDWENELDDQPWNKDTGSTKVSGGKIKHFAKKLAYETTGTREGDAMPYTLELGMLGGNGR